MAKEKDDGILANGQVLKKRRFDIEWNRNYYRYKPSTNEWFIYGNFTLSLVKDEGIISILNDLYKTKDL